MSLAPGERRALARIEDDLRRCDPRLADMLATFALPASRRLMYRGRRLLWWRPRKPFMLAAAVLTAVGLVIISLLQSS